MRNLWLFAAVSIAWATLYVHIGMLLADEHDIRTGWMGNSMTKLGLCLYWKIYNIFNGLDAMHTASEDNFDRKPQRFTVDWIAY